ncbi:hypothetical protein Caci_8512 [Catenulispora acidiphila DSM 44928]|uniref:Uncharacterized protein n=1 Tax=Catenulispora acidiphila (strain DSM 44928 / JCM 14897 / NBRC 102108 / NRRL B-24433 / ID139908) TaxID=479433 RepID=C7PYL3_CATAD|nr:hypothetical protein [Catenulispora acidiphila]ACU77335.1 hypothetical protein Caci_8512 [Catenulispora acidiphila DSM 44928]
MTAMLVPRENARFVLGPMPLLVVGEARVHAELPRLVAPEGRVPVCDGWQLMAGLTVCVLDGPIGGCLIPTMAESGDVQGMAAWCDAVAQNGGGVVVSLPQIPDEFDWDEIFGGGRARGGFVRGAELHEAD